jgi:2-polyprenyl-3-methyl-5-hydroxy-6-metoxy-1,4-benzoquinol methylase
LVGVIKRFGPSRVKQVLWDREFSGGHWDFIDCTAGDCVYSHLESNLNHGTILDLGCGPGNTATELSADSYRLYVGVDISQSALDKALRRSEESGRASKNRFVRSDFLSYVPSERFDVILIREAMYHVPQSKVKSMLHHYSEYLTNNGVFVVRVSTIALNGKVKRRLQMMVSLIEREFNVVEKRQYDKSGPLVITFRPRGSVGQRTLD